jgi:hypothetical protein
MAGRIGVGMNRLMERAGNGEELEREEESETEQRQDPPVNAVPQSQCDCRSHDGNTMPGTRNTARKF